ncbi:MAG: hypothetical protein GY765_34380 [bacterium]|nr:hypothetical protein [bacterium]
MLKPKRIYKKMTKKQLLEEIENLGVVILDRDNLLDKRGDEIKRLRDQSVKYEKEAADCYQQAIDNALSVKNTREAFSSKIQCVYSALELVFHTVSVDKPLNLRDKAAAKICNETLILINDFSKNRTEKWEVLYSALKDIFLEDVH